MILRLRNGAFALCIEKAFSLELITILFNAENWKWCSSYLVSTGRPKSSI